MKVTLVIKVCRFRKQILFAKPANLHNPITYVNALIKKKILKKVFILVFKVF